MWHARFLEKIHYTLRIVYKEIQLASQTPENLRDKKQWLRYSLHNWISKIMIMLLHTTDGKAH